MTTPQIVIELDGGAQGHYCLTAVAECSPELPASRPYEFTLRATHIESGRTSVVNQLNFVLSHFDASDQEDWPWVASWSKMVRWLRAVLDLARPNVNLGAVRSNWQDLEAALDEDRAEGEWANMETQRFKLEQDALQTELYNRAVAGRETWLTTRELLARVGAQHPPIQLGLVPSYFLGLNGDDVHLFTEEHGEHHATLAAFLHEYEELGRVWRWIESAPPSADQAIFPFCKECGKNADGALCHDCNVHVCNACAHELPNGDQVCEECHIRYLDQMKELDWERTNFDTPLAAQLDENLAEGIDY